MHSDITSTLLRSTFSLWKNFSWSRGADYINLACETILPTFGFIRGRLLGNSFFRRIAEEFDGLGDCSNALLTWYFVSALRCIALQYTVSSVPFREIVGRFGPFRSVK